MHDIKCSYIWPDYNKTPKKGGSMEIHEGAGRWNEGAGR